MTGKKNIFLIGMMGSWKSTVGLILAEKLQMNFVDIDDGIESLTGKSISEIFTDHGEERFRKMESDHLIEKSKINNQVFSTGGGIILWKKNRDILKNNGLTIFLRTTPQTLTGRIRDKTKRPLLSDADDIETRLTKIWEDRKDLYESVAHEIIDTDDMKPNSVMEAIIKNVEKRIANN